MASSGERDTEQVSLSFNNNYRVAKRFKLYLADDKYCDLDLIGYLIF